MFAEQLKIISECIKRHRPVRFYADDTKCDVEKSPCVTENYNEERRRHYPEKINFNLFYYIKSFYALSWKL